MPKYRVTRHEVTQPLDEPYRLIPLTQGHNAIVDIADFETLSQWNWRTHFNGFSLYAVRTATKNGYKRKNIYMHRYILSCKLEQEADHRNHNTLDNRRKNLRPCTSQQNKWNSRLRNDNSVGFRGVTKRKDNGRFAAQIVIDRKCRRLGCYTTPEEAARAYDKAAKEVHGEFAVLNFN